MLLCQIIHLYSSLQQSGGTILLGPCGAGKTTCHRILSLVLNRLYATSTQTAMLEEKRSHDHFENKTKPPQSVASTSTSITFPRVDVTTLFPGAMEPAEVHVQQWAPIPASVYATTLVSRFLVPWIQ